MSVNKIMQTPLLRIAAAFAFVIANAAALYAAVFYFWLRGDVRAD